VRPLLLAFVPLLGLASCVPDEPAPIWRAPDAGVPDPGPPDAGTPDASTETGVAGNGNSGSSAAVAIDRGGDLAALSRSVVAQRTNGAAFLVLRAHVMRDRVGEGTYTDSAIEVRHDGLRTRCGVAAQVVFRDQSGVLLARDRVYLSGSVRTGSRSAGCLGPGETGWLLGHHTMAFDRAATAEVALEEGTENGGVPAARLAIEQASYTGDRYSAKLAMTVRNRGSARATVGGYSGKYLLFSGDTPVSYGVLDTCGAGVSFPVGPGEGIELCDDVILFEGRADRVQAWIGFEDEAAPPR